MIIGTGSLYLRFFFMLFSDSMSEKLPLKQLLSEYDLEIDDIRWYLSVVRAQQLLSYEKNFDELVQFIWSGKLADSLHNMEEEYLTEIEDQLDRDILDETGIREILADAYALKNKRKWNSR